MQSLSQTMFSRMTLFKMAENIEVMGGHMQSLSQTMFSRMTLFKMAENRTHAKAGWEFNEKSCKVGGMRRRISVVGSPVLCMIM